jgi:Rad3-related DNA helicase
VLFSATLTPWNFYVDTLGLPDDTAWHDVAAPFRAEQLSVHIVRNVSTRYRDRSTSLEPIARLIAAQHELAPGNYIAFFSSFDYLEQAVGEFSKSYPHIPIWQQSRRMVEVERDAFLARFEVDGRGVGFAVLGGSFAEGIDLVGTRLIGAFIATLGLPQVNPINDELRRRLDTEFGAGYDYTYLFPGIRKVVQAAGRVIRTSSDSGTLHLIDDRFARPEVLRLLPQWWGIDTSCETTPQATASPGNGCAVVVECHQYEPEFLALTCALD